MLREFRCASALKKEDLNKKDEEEFEEEFEDTDDDVAKHFSINL